MNRAYSLLEIKGMDDDARIITGVASTLSPDRVDDVMVPAGATFKLPIPLLWQHNPNQPIGLVTKAKVTAAGIEIVAEIAKGVSDEIEDAWRMIKSGLVRGLSIGFKGLKWEPIPKSYGRKYLKWEWWELSAVTIPANAEATITSVKSVDAEYLAASGNENSVDTSDPGASGQSTQTVKLSKPKRADKMKSIAEQIAAFEATRMAKSARMEEIMTASAEAGETLDAAQSEEYDTLASEVKSIDTHLGRLRDMEKIKGAAAKPVNGMQVNNAADAANARSGIVIKAPKQMEKGIEFAQFAICLASAKGNLMQAHEIAKSRFGDNEALNISLKAAVSAGTTTDPTWAAPLVDTYQRFAGDFIEFLRPQTVIGRFGQGNIPSLRRVPFNISIAGQTTGGDGYWVGEGQAKPLTKFDYNTINLRWAKVANIAVLTEELLRLSNPSAEALVRDQLAAALIARLDTDFLDPAKAAVANVSSASITNGVTPIASSGVDAAAVRADVQKLFAGYIAANMTPASGVWVMRSTTALALSMMTNPLGQSEFSGLTMHGGTFWGMPVIVSEYTPEGVVILANASDIYLADDGQVVIDASREASLEMLDNPTNASGPTSKQTQLVSMFQTNSVAIRAERWINWQKRRPQAVQMLTDVNWGGVAPEVPGGG